MASTLMFWSMTLRVAFFMLRSLCQTAASSVNAKVKNDMQIRTFAWIGQSCLARAACRRPHGAGADDFASGRPPERTIERQAAR